ncbi:hypothetical protein AUC69_13280 [Methyloceanibacter superfactus]|uniref:Uncharacterized protein n=1 Tax=Methyloceanibacter superfactus TaxID=1774969 RepID=A0A1E3VU79_9HYPH|nr:hypothetical protein AUC69_13280 [Methyloceanibacter superfactus]
MGLLRGRTRVADARGDLQGAELDRLIDGHFEMGDAARHLVEGGEHGNRVLDRLGLGQPRRHGGKEARHGERRHSARSMVRSIG